MRLHIIKNLMKYLIYFVTFMLAHFHATFSGVYGQEQFVSRPKNQLVVQGDTSIIECEVANHRGRVQWARDGFVLGFNRTIPGNSRYSMIGDGFDGKHHLMIRNTSLEDDAPFQCQVSPADGGRQKAMTATANLTVLLPPSKIKLHSNGRDSTIEVSEGGMVTLVCHVQDAKPVANISWFKNDQQLLMGDSRTDKVKESSLEKRHNIISKLTVKLTAEDDGSVFHCQADHLALQGKPLRASIKISVLYPPGPPIVTGYSKDEILTAGRERIFNCVSRGGNPLGRIRWYRNDRLLDSTDRHIDGQSVNEHRFVVQPNDNGATFSCHVQSKLLSKPLVTSFRTTVHFPAVEVKVSGPSKARVGDNVTFMCFVRNSNPPSSISWVVNGKPHPVAEAGAKERSNSGGWHTFSNLTYQVPPVDRNIMFTCHATNEALGKTKIDTFMLSVLRPPQQPEIHGYDEGFGVRVGQEQSLSCIARGGNPPAHLQWFRNDIKIPSEKHSTGDVSTAKITIVAEPHDNGAMLRCEAHNSARSKPLSVSTSLTVYFPPTEVKISIQPDLLKADSQANLTCVAGPSNPPAKVVWYREGFMLKGNYQRVNEMAPNHGTTVTDILTMNLSSTYNGLSFRCEALNSDLQSKKSDSVVLDVLYAPEFLQTPPKSVDVVKGKVLEVNLTARGNPDALTYSWYRQGVPISKAVIEQRLRSDFNLGYRRRSPSISSSSRMEYGPTRVKNGGFVRGVTSHGPLLLFPNISVNDAGPYELKVSNSEGEIRAEVFVNVQYEAFVKASPSIVSVPIGGDAILACEVDGNPADESVVKWTRPSYDLEKTDLSFKNSKSLLKIRKVGRNDTGIFTCSAFNGLGSSLGSQANVSLVVEAKPIIKKSSLHSLSAAKLGSVGRLECTAEGAPAVWFSWIRNGRELPLELKSMKYHNETMKVGLLTYISVLEINAVADHDYGDYECVASNEKGKAVSIVHFSPPTAPRPPLSLKVLNTSHDSVTLEWVPGFDGGAVQHFRLRYRPKGRRVPYTFADVYEPYVTSYTVTGLELGTEYYFSIMGRNEFGNSDFGAEYVRAVTSRNAPPTPVPSSNVGRELGSAPMPALWVVIVVLVALALLVLNVSAIVCIVRRRRQKRGSGVPKKFLAQPKNSRREPSVPLAAVSSRSAYGSDMASSKSTSNTMYAPSSYNDTVAGETLSSISEKSRESYAQEDSVGEYDGMHDRNHPSDYLIDQIEPPPEYASRTPSSQPSSAAYDPTEDDYAEVLRRNAYNFQLGKGTFRPHSSVTQYSASPDSHGFVSHSYTPSPTCVAINGGPQYSTATLRRTANREPLNVEALECPGQASTTTFQALGLDGHPAPDLVLEQHSIPSEPSSLNLDPHSITIDHSHLSPYTFNGEVGGPRSPVISPTTTGHHTLSTFHPNPSPQSTFSEPELQGHLV